MTDLMELIFDYAYQFLLPRCLDHKARDELDRMEEKHLAALKSGLSAQQSALLEKYLEDLDESRALELRAMFLAAFSAARELR